MPKYKKKPIVVEAFQITEETRLDNSGWPGWLHIAWQKHPTETGCFFCSRISGDELHISTLEGTLDVTLGDFIIQGIQGELYPCKPDIFHATYDAFETLSDLYEVKSEE